MGNTGCSSRGSAQLPAPTWQLTATSHSSFRRSDALFWTLMVLHISSTQRMCRETEHSYTPQKRKCLFVKVTIDSNSIRKIGNYANEQKRANNLVGNNENLHLNGEKRPQPVCAKGNLLCFHSTEIQRRDQKSIFSSFSAFRFSQQELHTEFYSWHFTSVSWHAKVWN